MRNFFLFVLLINLLAFAYQSWILEPATSVAPDFAAQDVPELLPVERKKGTPTAVITPSAVTADSGAAIPFARARHLSHAQRGRYGGID